MKIDDAIAIIKKADWSHYDIHSQSLQLDGFYTSAELDAFSWWLTHRPNEELPNDR